VDEFQLKERARDALALLSMEYGLQRLSKDEMNVQRHSLLGPYEACKIKENSSEVC
jgi:hypothetical protein